jgi:predicted histidine transporter YuiF (NhaC family)
MNIIILQAGIQATQTPAQQIAEASGNNTSLFIFLGIIGVLTFLFFFFLKRTDRIVEERERLKQEQKHNAQVKSYEEPTEEIAAAIALAISMYAIQMAELENLTLTIQKVSKQYSPWSSKIYTLRQLPR